MEHMENDFQKKIEGWRNQRLTNTEKAFMLEHVFAAPIPSPYARYARVLVYVKRPAVMVLVLCLLFSTSIAYASQAALPGDALYTVKTKVLEPIVDIIATAPVQKLKWEQEKVARRLIEAQALADKNELDEKKVTEIQKNIEKSSARFGAAAEEVSKRSATSTEKQVEKQEDLKRQFRASLNIRKEVEGSGVDSSEKNGRGEKNDQIEHLKERAAKALEGKSEDDHKGRD